MEFVKPGYSLCPSFPRSPRWVRKVLELCRVLPLEMWSVDQTAASASPESLLSTESQFLSQTYQMRICIFNRIPRWCLGSLILYLGRGVVIGKFWLGGPGLKGKAKPGACQGKDLLWTGRHNYCCMMNLDHSQRRSLFLLRFSSVQTGLSPCYLTTEDEGQYSGPREGEQMLVLSY